MILILFITTTMAAYAQRNYKRVHNRMLDEAKLMMNNGYYEEATKIYKRLLPMDSGFAEVFHEMGVCLVNIPGQKEKSVPHFEHAMRLGHLESFYELGLARHRQQRFDESVDLLRSYKQLHGRAVRDAEVDHRIGHAVNAKALVREPIDVRIRNLGPMVNSPAHDYCPLVTADGNTMYFTSRRRGTTGERKDGSGQWFEDIWMARRIDDEWTNAVNVRGPLNTAMHDATVGLSPDGRSMIIYRTHPNLVSGDLYGSEYTNGKWTEPMLLTDRINSKHHEPSASIAPGGDEIYFTSDRPGGYGGRDIYRIRRLPNGQWSLPLNLGPNVNTAHDEDAPFIHSDGVTLFFSSKGHNSMGGYDIFKTVLTDPDMNGWSIPENMGYPLNTVNDDIYFCLSEDGLTGWFSSERPGGLGMQDIYQVEFPGSQLDYLVVRGVVTDTAEEPVKARIVVTDPKSEELQGVYNSNERTGRYLLVLTPGMRYSLTVEAPGFATRSMELHARTINGTRELPMDILLTRGEQSLTRHD
ncbi:MAG: PD40 domain-containing protein [Flavobacteriales bacterium]|nr:PD40 domain-containing protein [Flavobacteriales bacterium]